MRDDVGDEVADDRRDDLDEVPTDPDCVRRRNGAGAGFFGPAPWQNSLIQGV